MGCAIVKHDPRNDVFRKYDFLFLLGKGRSCQVHEAVAKSSSGNSVAIKCTLMEEYEVSTGPVAELHARSQLWKGLSHCNICKLQESFDDNIVHYAVLELCDGSTFFELLEAEIVLEEPVVMKFLQQMLGAVEYMHARDIVHRDLKPESWLLHDQNPAKQTLKLTNFDCAKTCKEGDKLTCPGGTLHYLAPEVLMGCYDKKVDIWTLGIVFFLSCYACYPFDGEDCQGVMQTILSNEPDWADSCYALSADASLLLRRMLAKDPATRPRAAELSRHRLLASKIRPVYVSQSSSLSAMSKDQRLSMVSHNRQGTMGPQPSILMHRLLSDVSKVSASERQVNSVYSMVPVGSTPSSASYSMVPVGSTPSSASYLPGSLYD